MESIAAAACMDEEAPLLKTKNHVEDPSSWRLITMTFFAFPISVIWATMGMVVLPAEALRLYPSDEAIHLGFMLTVVAFSQLICPVAGKLSDRCRSKWGKRRPYILVGTLLTFVACAGLWCSSKFMLAEVFMLCLLISQIGLNVIYTAQASLVPDNYKENMGSASGIIACLQLSGSFVGMTWIILNNQYDYHYTYGFHLVLLSLALVVVSRIYEKPTDDLPDQSPLTLTEVLDSFKIDIEGDHDFFLVFIGRMLFYIAMSCQTFSYFYFRDMLLITDQSMIRYQLAVLTLLGTFVGICASYPLGVLSDKVGRKFLIYLACAAMAAVYLGYICVPLYFSPSGGAIYAVYAIGCLYGLGMAGYTSVDYALALDCLPEKHKGSSEALGLWGIAGFVGSSVGPLLGGSLLEMNGAPAGGYTYPGYVMMISVGLVSIALCAFVTSFIKKVD